MSFSFYKAAKKAALLCLVLSAAVIFGSMEVFATTATTADPDRNVPTVSVSSNSQETLGSIIFSQANAKRIAVGKSTVLYLSIKDMGYNFYTEYSSSDKTIATVTYVDSRAVKVVGLKNGVVIITAKVESSTGVKTAQYKLIIGDAQDTDATASGADNDNFVGIITDTNDNVDLELFSSTTDPMLLAYAESRSENNATSLLLGLIGWAVIIASGVYVFSVVIRTRTPKMSTSPGTRKRYSAGGASRSSNRLLPNKYYRNLKKY